jgi:hypothetical protein
MSVTYPQIIASSLPFRGFGSEVQIVMAVREGLRPPCPEDSTTMSEQLWVLITDCWNADVAFRPNMKEVSETVSAVYVGCLFQPD